MEKNNKEIDSFKLNWYDSYKKIRKKWYIKPVTKIKESDKKYNRKKEKKKWKKAINEEI